MAEDESRERLAHIEATLLGIKDTLDRMVTLFDRVLTIEVANRHRDDRLDRLEGRCAVAEGELGHWRVARVIGTWVLGISGAVLTAWLAHRVGL